MSPQMQQIVNNTGNTASLAALGGWFIGVLPVIATTLTAVWFSILITEKITGKQLHELVIYVWRKICG